MVTQGVWESKKIDQVGSDNNFFGWDKHCIKELAGSYR